MVSTFTADDLKARAGERSFARAGEYPGAVADLEVTVDGVAALVQGGDVYKVTLTVDGGVGGHCGCPFGLDGNFCKHCVAVGPVGLNRGIDLPEARAAAEDRGQRLDAWLETLPRDDLSLSCGNASMRTTTCACGWRYG
ncbi:hypothetical protein [Actinomadura sp. DC4]|uniref:SWIM zinc finger family protein n=1 Tax=Actinomadura sp. DC4 TaxID=3055069 RepID=UPI0025B08C62|nr:hypothetical protein [Actinomadura sp. DC4]MDN3351368.1 hypothetical protein [Actinomadura sp. DC4]